jgi:hypothetical protein
LRTAQAAEVLLDAIARNGAVVDDDVVLVARHPSEGKD